MSGRVEPSTQWEVSSRTIYAVNMQMILRSLYSDRLTQKLRKEEEHASDRTVTAAVKVRERVNCCHTRRRKATVRIYWDEENPEASRCHERVEHQIKSIVIENWLKLMIKGWAVCQLIRERNRDRQWIIDCCTRIIRAFHQIEQTVIWKTKPSIDVILD